MLRAILPRLVLLGLLMMPCGEGRCAPPAADGPPVAVLFVGNSFTHGRFSPVRNYNSDAVTDENFRLPPGDPRTIHAASEFGPYGGIPGIFKKLTDQAGLRYEVHVEAVSATSLEFHYQHALPLIAQARWNAVVLQEYSTLPLPAPRGGNPEKFLTHAALLEKAVHAANPAARLYLYETWPRADLTYPERAPYHGQPIDGMGIDLHDAYERARAADGHFAGVAWTGDAWLDAIRAGTARADPYPGNEKMAGLDLWGPDHYHPSTYGAYLCALVLFQEITGVAAPTLGPGEQAAHALGISATDAVHLQAVAGTVRHPPSPSATGAAAVRD